MLNGLVKSLKEQLSEADSTKERLGSEIQETSHALEALRGIMTQSKSDIEAANHQSVGAEHTATAHVAKEDASTLRPTDTTITWTAPFLQRRRTRKERRLARARLSRPMRPKIKPLSLRLVQEVQRLQSCHHLLGLRVILLCFRKSFSHSASSL
jgi:phage shock protein A